MEAAHAATQGQASYPYSSQKRQWLSQEMKKLERTELVYGSAQAVFASVAMAMAKGEYFLLVADYCAENQQLKAVP